MLNGIDVETFDIKRFAEALVRDCQEGVKWEHRKLQWIREEQAAKNAELAAEHVAEQAETA